MTDGVESRMLREIMARTGTDKRLNSADELTRLRTEHAALRATLKQAREVISESALMLKRRTQVFDFGANTVLANLTDALSAIDKVQP